MLGSAVIWGKTLLTVLGGMLCTSQVEISRVFYADKSSEHERAH